MPEKPKKTSNIIAEIIADCLEDGTVTVSEFLAKMGNRASALAILVFSLSSLVAGIIPGFSTVMALPIIFIALQMALGRSKIWLPRSIRTKQVSPRVIQGALSKSMPVLRSIEHLLKPRLLFLTHPVAERILALVISGLAVILSLPIPAGNFIPSMGIVIISLAILERDGFLVIGAITLIFLTGGVMIEMIQYAIYLLQALMDMVW